MSPKNWCVACHSWDGSYWISQRNGCGWTDVPQLPWMEVYGLAPADVEGYWVCPGCAQLVNRDLNREHREIQQIQLVSPRASCAKILELEPLIRILKSSKSEAADSDTTTIADAVSIDDWWKVAFTTLNLSQRIDQTNSYYKDYMPVDDDVQPAI